MHTSRIIAHHILKMNLFYIINQIINLSYVDISFKVLILTEALKSSEVRELWILHI